MKRNVLFVVLGLAGCALGGCGSCADGNDPPPAPAAQQPASTKASSSTRQIRAPLIGMRPIAEAGEVAADGGAP